MYNLLVARSRWCGPIMTLSVSDFWLAHSRSEPNCYSTTNPFRFGMNLSSPALSKKLSTNNTVQCHFQFPCRAIEFVHYRYSTADYNTFNSISSVWIYSPSLTLRLYEIPLLPLTVVTAGHSSYMSKRGCQCLSRSSFSAIATWITGFASKRGSSAVHWCSHYLSKKWAESANGAWWCTIWWICSSHGLSRFTDVVQLCLQVTRNQPGCTLRTYIVSTFTWFRVISSRMWVQGQFILIVVRPL